MKLMQMNHYALMSFHLSFLHCMYVCVCVFFLSPPSACIVCVLVGEYLCLQKELESIPMSTDEREARQRRAANQYAANQLVNGSDGHEEGHARAERSSLISEEKELRGERNV